jgi:hypothetical protein
MNEVITKLNRMDKLHYRFVFPNRGKDSTKSLRSLVSTTATSSSLSENTTSVDISAEHKKVEKYKSIVTDFHALLLFLRYSLFANTATCTFRVKQALFPVPASPTATAATAMCSVCSKAHCVLRCSGCKAVYYCSRDHQRQDWKIHKVGIVVVVIIIFGVLAVVRLLHSHEYFLCCVTIVAIVWEAKNSVLCAASRQQLRLRGRGGQR